jgi:hypothetical protein
MSHHTGKVDLLTTKWIERDDSWRICQDNDINIHLPPTFSIQSHWPSIHHRESIKHCAPCAETSGCIFCLSSLQCEDSSLLDFYCYEDAEDSSKCPGLIPPCRFLADCESCSHEDACSWCSARDECILADDIDSLSGCFDTSTCPPLAAVNLDVFEGKLVVTNDGSFGGALEVGGSCSVKGCHDNHHYSLSVDEDNVKVESAGSYLCLLFLTSPSCSSF